jgi:hypothetical protein
LWWRKKMKVMVKFMIEYIKENPRDFVESIGTIIMIGATAYMFYFLGYVFFGPTI